MGETMTQLDDFLKRVDKAKAETNKAREAAKPLREAAHAARQALTELERERLNASDVVTAYRKGEGDVTDEQYLAACQALDLLDVKIERQRDMASAAKVRADDAGRQLAYGTQAITRRIVDDFQQWQQEQHRQLVDAIARL